MNFKQHLIKVFIYFMSNKSSEIIVGQQRQSIENDGMVFFID